VTFGSTTHVTVNGGVNDPITVLTAPAGPASGVYYLNASLTVNIAHGDIAMCQLRPASAEPGGATTGPAPVGGELASMSLTEAVTLSAGHGQQHICCAIASDSLKPDTPTRAQIRNSACPVNPGHALLLSIPADQPKSQPG